MLEAFHAAHHRAQEALMLGQHFQRRSYNKGQLSFKFQEGDLVLLNPHSYLGMKQGVAGNYS